MRALEKFFQQSQLIEQFEGGRMDGVAAEVAQKIGMLLEHADIDASAGEKEAHHHTGGTATGDAAAGLDAGRLWSHRRNFTRSRGFRGRGSQSLVAKKKGGGL